MKRTLRMKAGFTLIEILVVIGILAILAAAVLIAVNPARQFAQARDSQRATHVNAILNAIGQNIADNKGIFTCAGSALPATAAVMNSSGDPGTYDIAACLEPTYISQMPIDPVDGAYIDTTDYDSDYTVMQDATTKRITISADGEVAGTISVTR